MATQTSSQNSNLGLPNLQPDIYRASSSLDAVTKHIESLGKEITINPSNMNAMLLKMHLSNTSYIYQNSLDAIARFLINYTKIP